MQPLEDAEVPVARGHLPGIPGSLSMAMLLTFERRDGSIRDRAADTTHSTWPTQGGAPGVLGRQQTQDVPEDAVGQQLQGRHPSWFLRDTPRGLLHAHLQVKAPRGHPGGTL